MNTQTQTKVAEHIFSKYWPERQKDSEEKWAGIKRMVKIASEDGDSYLRRVIGRDHFLREEVMRACGYCHEFGSGRPCKTCPLAKDKYCQNNNTGDNTTYWQFVYEMHEPVPHWDKALELAKKMHERIKQDRPVDKKV